MLQKVTFVSTQLSTEPLREVVIECGDFGRILFNGQPLRITKVQKFVLEYLILRANRQITVDDILDHLFTESLDPPMENSIRVYICAMRKALDKLGFGNHLGNQHGRGYIFYLNGAKVLLKKVPDDAHTYRYVSAASAHGRPADGAGENTPL